MKESWENRDFVECLKKVPKQKAVKSKDYLEEGLYPVVSQESCLVSGYSNIADILFRHDRPVVIFGDHTKNIKYIDFDFVVGADGVHILDVKDDILPKFFYYELCSIKLRNLGYARHYKLLKEKCIKFPSLPEQEKIVSYLDAQFAKIDTLKANAASQLQAAKDLFQSALKQLLTPKEGWEKDVLRNVCEVVNGRAYSQEEMLSSGKYRILRVGNFFTNDSWYYSNLELEEKKYCENGDLLYAWSASFGPRIWHGEKVIYHYHIWKMICSDSVNKFYMKYWLDSDNFKQQVMTDLHGATMSHITKTLMETVIVPIPSLSEQERIAARLDAISEKVKALQDNYDQTITLCNDLKQSLLKSIFE